MLGKSLDEYYADFESNQSEQTFTALIEVLSQSDYAKFNVGLPETYSIMAFWQNRLFDLCAWYRTHHQDNAYSRELKLKWAGLHLHAIHYNLFSRQHPETALQWMTEHNNWFVDINYDRYLQAYRNILKYYADFLNGITPSDKKSTISWQALIEKITVQQQDLINSNVEKNVDTQELIACYSSLLGLCYESASSQKEGIKQQQDIKSADECHHHALQSEKKMTKK